MNKYQEALECLKDNLALRPYCRVDSSIKIIENNTERTIEFDVHKSYTLLKELIDKEEPTKPTFEADGYFDGELVYDTWICPNCGKRYELDYQEFKRCPECGQLIDWSKDE